MDLIYIIEREYDVNIHIELSRYQTPRMPRAPVQMAIQIQKVSRMHPVGQIGILERMQGPVGSAKACFEEARDLARAILDVNPYNSGHGKTTAAWDEVLKRLNESKK
ncbi:uncharacterized protein LAJ45_11345 [Morchella importuna]|uniref:uncharacterized protein n=1 Tax=Morchella importuna TaxID=1174673 RepID=UPI001E8E78CB|nr:uncharacterized protein LAJ45_11345 [Morchella importuna]KAH8144637.1 hypothetical protein LAJ45_11345 [Morchella importuna]